MDHAASLPYVLAKTPFRGRVYMTHATKAIYKWTMQDAVRVQNTHTTATQASGSDGYVSQLYTEQDIISTLPQIQTISFNTTHTHNGIKITPYPAGHVLGACMYLIEIAGLNVLFTGDYSRENDRHLIPAAVPRGVKVDCLITESTFGISTHTPLHERETALTKSITSILNRGGRALLPVSAVGQTQNLLLILEDYWHRHPEFRQYPIYYASNLARKCMVVFQTYIDSMNASIRAKFAEAQANGGTGGPWDFEFIRNLRHGAERFEDVGGCVMLAAPGMMQNGTSRAFLEKWAPDAKNGVVATGYSVEGTMGKQILQEPDSIPSIMNRNSQNALGKRPGAEQMTMIPRRCTVQEISFAAHVDGQENREFIEEVDAKVVILVHGEKHNMNRMKSRLLSLQKFRVFSPANCEEVRIPFRQDKVARVVGRLASEVQPPGVLPSPPASEGEGGAEEEGEAKKRRQEGQGAIMTGVLVQNDFKLSLMAPEDLKEYAGLTTTTILCRQRITLAAAGVGLIQWALEGTFGNVNPSGPGSETKQPTNGTTAQNGKKQDDADEEIDRKDPTTFEIMGGAVKVLCRDGGEVELEWEGNAMNDSIADAVMAVLLTIESSPAAVKHSAKAHGHTHRELTPEYDAFGDIVQKTANGFGDEDIAMANASSGPGAGEPNPFNPSTAQEKLNRLFMFLEAQFGEEAVTPIAEPKLPAGEGDEGDDVAVAKAKNAELARLHDMGIPVPGVEIKVDKLVAKVWLEKLEVECANRVLAERVRAVVERGVGVVAPAWV